MRKAYVLAQTSVSYQSNVYAPKIGAHVQQ
jgi:hypothetical protein